VAITTSLASASRNNTPGRTPTVLIEAGVNRNTTTL
jgi:hypothetical protein